LYFVTFCLGYLNCYVFSSVVHSLKKSGRALRNIGNTIVQSNRTVSFSVFQFLVSQILLTRSTRIRFLCFALFKVLIITDILQRLRMWAFANVYVLVKFSLRKDYRVHVHTALHSPAQPYTALHSPTQPYTALYSPTQPYTALHSPTQPYTALHSPTQPCTAIHSHT